MPADAANRINLALMAHVDAGKTTLTEQLLFQCGAIRKLGRVDDGTARTDSLAVERERGISVRAAVTSLEWSGCAINLIDTPGHTDFAGEVDRVFGAPDAAALLISAVEGIQSNTIGLLRAFSRAGLPYLIFLNKIDRAGSHCAEIVRQLNADFGGGFRLMNAPLQEGERECPVTALPTGEAFTELLADFDDDAAESFLEGIPFPEERQDLLLRRLCTSGTVHPVLCGAALAGTGVKALLQAIVRWLPRASEKLCPELSGIVFKLEHDKTMGKVAHVRLFGGSVKKRDMLFPNEKVSQIRKWSGDKYTDEDELCAGDIGSLCGLSSARCGSIIGRAALHEESHLANPFLCISVAPENEAQLPALVTAARELSEEDPLLDVHWEKTEREVQLNITGQIQAEVLQRLFQERYGLQTRFSPPAVIYRETPSKAGFGFEAYTMPKPCWAVVKLLLEPLPRGSGVEWCPGNVPNDKLFYRYQSQIKTAFFRALEQGLSGWQVTDLRATLVDGEHHIVHTHPLDFFVATPMAVMNGLQNTGTTLLEPLLSVHISAGEECFGRVTGDIIQMRGTFDAPVVRRGIFSLDAVIPAATSLEYPIRFASLTSGKGLYAPSFYGYRECPPGFRCETRRRGVDPLDHSKWILYVRGAYSAEE